MTLNDKLSVYGTKTSTNQGFQRCSHVGRSPRAAPDSRVVTARALGPDGIDLIDEDDARGVFSSLEIQRFSRGAILGCPRKLVNGKWVIPPIYPITSK